MDTSSIVDAKQREMIGTLDMVAVEAEKLIRQPIERCARMWTTIDIGAHGAAARNEEELGATRVAGDGAGAVAHQLVEGTHQPLLSA